MAAKVFYPTRILSKLTAGDMLDWIDDNLRAGEKALLINLQNVLFMDSSGLGSLVTALKRVRAAGGRMGLCCLSGQARMLFDHAGMNRMFEIYETPEEFNKTVAIP